jgi:hypothetical protein
VDEAVRRRTLEESWAGGRALRAVLEDRRGGALACARGDNSLKESREPRTDTD